MNALGYGLKVGDRCLLALVLWAGLGLAARNAVAEDLKVEATLVWATNDEKAKEKYKQVEEALSKELKQIFQWKYYYEMRTTNGVVASRGTKAFEMSHKCVVKVTELEGPEVIVELFGEGKPVNKTKKPLQRGEIVTIGGGDRDGGAWFVVIKRKAE